VNPDEQDSMSAASASPISTFKYVF